MIYLWKREMSYPEKMIGWYDHDASPDYILFMLGKKLNKNEFVGTFDDHIHEYPTIRFNVPKKALQDIDCLRHNTSIPLVSEHLRLLLKKIAPNDVEFFEAKVFCQDGELPGYYFLNAFNTIRGIDFEKSLYERVDMPEGAFRYNFDYMTYKLNVMSDHVIARDKDYPNNLLVREDAMKTIQAAKMKGVYLVRPEDFYRPITIDDLTGGQAED